METNDLAREQIFEIVNNQIKDNNPPETRVTYKRLIDMGYTDFVTKQLIGQCIAVELFEVMKFGKKYNEKRYINNLKNLPKEPFND
ncbi:MAG: hypothetical protein NTZ33_08355 [Bacteroidetes bacterium]|nr:hypothetical protein [Bacteroidota bacterium]